MDYGDDDFKAFILFVVIVAMLFILFPMRIAFLILGVIVVLDLFPTGVAFLILGLGVAFYVLPMEGAFLILGLGVAFYVLLKLAITVCKFAYAIIKHMSGRLSG